MRNKLLDKVFERIVPSAEDSDFTLFFTLMVCGEALVKTVVLGLMSALAKDKERSSYNLEYLLVRSDGIGEWGRALEQLLNGPASQHLINEAGSQQRELANNYRQQDWQYESTALLKEVLDDLKITSEVLPPKTDMKRWFRLFSTLRNKTRAHGASLPGLTSGVCQRLEKSIRLFYENYSLFDLPWAFLHRNYSGKYRVTCVSGTDCEKFNYLKTQNKISLPNGVYIFWDSPREVPLLVGDPDLQDFFLPNGGMGTKRFELMSYASGDRIDGDSRKYSTPPGELPTSETHSIGGLVVKGNCFSNVPEQIKNYISRPGLEEELYKLLIDNRRPIVTLVGRGGIGKTSLALKVVHDLMETERFECVIWLSARDIDLKLTGPKPVKPSVFSPKDMSRLYAALTLSEDEIANKSFDAQKFFEHDLQQSGSDSSAGTCLFVFDNFETTQNPIEIFGWLDTHIRLPNKILITTRLREFKGDYPVDVRGMEDREARALIDQTSAELGISSVISEAYKEDIAAKSEGHPYIIKILLGEVAKQKREANIPRLLAGTDEVLISLFERTYASISPCAQRAFLTLSGWNAAVPRLALEAVLLRSTEERSEVENGVESLLLYSMAEENVSAADRQPFISVPLVALVFGKKKLNISPFKDSIRADIDVLQLLETSTNDVELGLARKLDKFIANIALRVEEGVPFEEFRPILEMICQSYTYGWLILAKWQMEQRTDDSYKYACKAARYFLENEFESPEIADAWKILGHACYQLGDYLGEIHAFIERAQLSDISFRDISNTANRLNELGKKYPNEFDSEQKNEFARRLLDVMDQRVSAADADDYSRMAWLAISINQENRARAYVEAGLKLEFDNIHCQRIAERLGMDVTEFEL
ncbi:MAG: hypothetical protein JXR76_22045 [Deltaproteobacteria bacterium]|nr:hypothetical protein [Deltaproteobacteria bacterium]